MNKLPVGQSVKYISYLICCEIKGTLILPTSVLFFFFFFFLRSQSLETLFRKTFAPIHFNLPPFLRVTRQSDTCQGVREDFLKITFEVKNGSQSCFFKDKEKIM